MLLITDKIFPGSGNHPGDDFHPLLILCDATKARRLAAVQQGGRPCVGWGTAIKNAEQKCALKARFRSLPAPVRASDERLRSNSPRREPRSLLATSTSPRPRKRRS